ncbi:hypothetical protein LTR56_023647 [Elasticomyces elasticus]|nr:hypothetical protein LTR56_023647 [Elasticomyces elasticus]KAK3625005.1 hypothetical protein LTR22_023754 [Elasticomyces elasticus]KAK4906602.1 hypothetical protein LTR49_024298 [Elasticomyces elasticus]
MSYCTDRPPTTSVRSTTHLPPPQQHNDMAASLIRPTTTRAVHLRITPRPSNIGESREILRLISQFGEVEYFKNLKYDALSAPNTAIVIFRDEDAAKKCLKKTPIRFRMGRAMPLDESQVKATDQDSRIFQIQINTARAHFRDLLNSSHFHGAFRIDEKSVAQQDLSKRVPMLGLSDVDWRADEKPWKIVEREKESAGAFKGSGRRKSLQEVFEEANS